MNTSDRPVFLANVLLAIAMMAMLSHGRAAMADESASAVPAPDSPQSQYQFLIGDWDVEVTLRRPQGDDLEYRARWHSHWLADGQVLLQEWSGPYAKGLELRTYSSQLKRWEGRNIYLPQPATWYENSAEWINGEMIVTTHRNTAGGGEMITKEIYHDIGPDRFAIRSETSTDGGLTWGPGRYQAKSTRASSD